eukprot:jgi/Ulvmu1/12575/UM092_0005.1
MWLILFVHVLLFTANRGSAKPYCHWQVDRDIPSQGMCVETADANFPGRGGENCTDEEYTQLVSDIRTCLRRQDSEFKSCKPRPRNTTGYDVCKVFPIKYQRRDDDAVELGTGGDNETLADLQVCLPSANRSVDGFSSYNARHMGDLLTALNVCEGRGANRTLDLNTNELNISAPCTCIDGPVSDSQLCADQTVLPEAQQQCCGCKNVWDVWLHDYIGRSTCRTTAYAAYSLQALCRAKETPEECAAVNRKCGFHCGGPLSGAPQTTTGPVHFREYQYIMCGTNTTAAPVPEALTATDDVSPLPAVDATSAAAQEQVGAAAAMSRAAPLQTSAAPWPALAAAAAAVILHAHRAF